MENPTGTVVITAREIYDELRGIRGDLRVVATTIPNHKEAIDDHETRIRTLEQKVWAASGIAALVTGGGVTLIQNLIGG